ncbi:HAD family hydrolase [Thermomonospora cellulosilytica]|uniref:Putative hydrolase of the HAD superfamily n=1 Tax=Thermomonospora cellulosilytica TaxID=1411118 RepID=A0A7W3MTX2_9ACTN|nr:HAD family hydrolase [Thermomonospora cellulosilytica]MBA9001835.1 putative hydrolase of the HAD superfamily [Thermomonospora cellulosilytica]
MVEAVLWDFDDTILDYSSSDQAGIMRHFTAEGLPCDEEALARWRSVTDREFARFLAGELTFQEQRRERARAMTGLPLSDAEADAWFARYLVFFEEACTAFPDVVPVLDALPHRHAILSNSNTVYQERRLAALGLRDRFEALLCAGEIGSAKPDPAAFLAACDVLGLKPAQVAYVGDKLDVDALGARDAGLHGIWLDRSRTATTLPDGVHRIAALTELPTLLQALGQEGTSQ